MADTVVSIAYAKQASSTFDAALFSGPHLELVKKSLPGVLEAEAIVFKDPPTGGKSDWNGMMLLRWKDERDAIKAMDGDAFKKVTADFETFTNETPVIVWGNCKGHAGHSHTH